MSKQKIETLADLGLAGRASSAQQVEAVSIDSQEFARLLLDWKVAGPANRSAAYDAIITHITKFRQAATGSAEGQSIARGYESGTVITDSSRLSATISLHYESPEEAESAFETITSMVDAAILAQQGAADHE